MKKHFAVLLTLVLLALAACMATQNEQSATTVPSSTGAPVDANSVPTTLPPTARPSATEEPITAEPSSAGLDAFVMQLETAVTSQDYAQMEALMSDPIGIGGWRSEWRMYTPDQTILAFQSGSLPAPLAVQFSALNDDEITALIGQPPASMFGPTTNIAAALHSSGWGQSMSDDAILFVAEEDGRYYWHAFLYTNGRFADASLTTVVPPGGLIYRAFENGILQIQADGTPGKLFDEQTALLPNLQVSPDGKHAAYINEERQLWLIDSVTGDQQQLAAGFDLNPFFVWGDAGNILMGVWLDPNEADGPNNGHMAVTNIDSGEVVILDEEHLTWNRPTMLTNGGLVAFDILPSSADDIMTGRIYDPETGLQPFNPGSFSPTNDLISSPIFNPSWSPDGSQISWLATTGERFAVQLFDLEGQTSAQIFDWDPARFGGLVPSPVWSPDGHWLALDVLANGPEGSGIWLLAADGSQTLVDAQGHNPYWLDDFQMVFNLNNETRLFDRGSEQQFRLDLPEFSAVLGYSALDEPSQAVETPVAFVLALQDLQMFNGPGETYAEIGGVFDGQTALVTGQSLDGAWWRVICPDETVGDCWVTADPAYTLPSNSQDTQGALPDPDTLSMASEVTFPSPDDRWQATAAYSDPLIISDQEKYYASLTVTNGETVWTPIAEWRNYGLGYTWPSIVQWSTDGSSLYYTNEVLPDGCAVFANGTDLYRLDVVDGQVTELIPPGRTLNFALAADESAVAYTQFAGGQYSLVVQDTTGGAKRSMIIAETGQDRVQPGNILWSPDGTQIFLAVAYNDCSPTAAHSILRIDGETMAATTLIEKDDRLFFILDMPDLEQNELRLSDKDGQTWRLDIVSGKLTQQQ